jgi:hypothetical protein
VKLKKFGFLPQNRTKFARLFFAIKSLFILILFLYSVNSLIEFLPFRNQTLFLIGLSLFLLLIVSKVLQGICVYQNVYIDLYEHSYTRSQKALIYSAYLISLVIVPLSFVFLVLQYNSVIDVEKLKILNKSIAIFFIFSIIFLLIAGGIFLSLASKLIEKVQYTNYKDEDNKIDLVSDFKEKEIAIENKNKRSKEIEKLNDEINKIDYKKRNLRNTKYRDLMEKINQNKDLKGYYYIKIGADIKDESQYKIIQILGVLANLMDLSLLSINSIDFIKNNHIEAKSVTEYDKEPKIILNSFCDWRYIYKENN